MWRWEGACLGYSAIVVNIAIARKVAIDVIRAALFLLLTLVICSDYHVAAIRIVHDFLEVI